MMCTRSVALLAAATLGLALAGCQGGHSSGGATSPGARLQMGSGKEPASVPGKYGGKLTEATISDPKTFNLWVSAESSSGAVVGPLYEPLNQRNAYTLKFEPRLAALPKISSDGLTYTYTLRDGLTWSDGQPLTADDVIFTLDVIFDPKIQTIMRESMMVEVAEPNETIQRLPFKYRKVDAHTVEFKLPQRYAPAETMFSFPIAPRHKLEAAYKAGTFNSTWSVNTPVSELVSSGPFIIAEYAPGQRVVYQRNPRFWRKGVDGKPLPYLDQFVYLIVPDINATTLKFRSGETDVLAVQAPDYPFIKKEEGSGNYTVLDLGPGWGFEYLGFNMNPESSADKDLISLFQDVRFRRAISELVNRQRIVDDIYLGLGQPLYGPVTPANSLFYDANIPKYEYNPDKAKALLAEIGLKPASGTGMLAYHGKEVKFNVLTNTENNLRKSIATIITADLKKVGLNAQFTPINFNDLVRRVMAPPYDWQACILGIGGSPEPHDGSSLWRSSGPMHLWHPKEQKPAAPWEAEIDQLWARGAQELDPAKRKAIYDRWQTIVGEQQPFTFTAVPDSISAVRSRFGNLKPCSLGRVTWNIEEIFDTTATRNTP
jgi:peptide/nickel transport system substrate-binding protein